MKKYRYDLGESDFLVVSAETTDQAHEKIQKLLAEIVVRPEDIIEVEE